MILIAVRTAERVDRDEYSSNVRVYLRVGPPFLEVLIDALVANRREKGHVGYTDLLLLEALLPVGLQKWKHLGTGNMSSSSDRTLATLDGAPAFLPGATFFPAFFEGACPTWS
jgi:hypothetical protein